MSIEAIKAEINDCPGCAMQMCWTSECVDFDGCCCGRVCVVDDDE